ncbi:hypothetical protein E2320_014399 [Naja naja]|nr:hypothetical protein E2320_014399 [Naja naja]
MKAGQSQPHLQLLPGSTRGALAGRGGGRSSPGTEPPLLPWREGREPLPVGNARAGSPRGEAKERDPQQLPCSWRWGDLLSGGAAWKPEGEQPHLSRAGPRSLSRGIQRRSTKEKAGLAEGNGDPARGSGEELLHLFRAPPPLRSSSP